MHLLFGVCVYSLLSANHSNTVIFLILFSGVKTGCS